MSTGHTGSDRFWLSIVASTALAVGACVVIGKLAPNLIGIPEAGSQADRLSIPKVLVIDANDAMVRLGETLPEGMINRLSKWAYK